jgi:predicted aspartyl protease
MLFDVPGARWRDLGDIVAAPPRQSLRTQFTKTPTWPAFLRAPSNPFTNNMPVTTRRQFIRSTAVLACGIPSAWASESVLDTFMAKDTAGRLLVPTYVNGHGPYRFMLDTGASHCLIAAEVATRLKLPPADSATVSVQRTTGRSTTPAVAIESLEVGAMRLERRSMPVIAEPGMIGVIGADALVGQRIAVDVKVGRLLITSSPDESIDDTRVQQRFGGLLLAAGTVGSVNCKFILDTGAQRSIGNLALARRSNVAIDTTDPVIVQTPDAAVSATVALPTLPIEIGSEAVVNLSIACARLPVFASWELAEEPAVLLGMDYFSQLSSFAIDYRHSRLSVRQEGR